MPNKSYKKKISKRFRKRRFRKGTKKAVIPRSTVVFGAGLPKKCIVKHRYVETFSLSSVVGSIPKHFWSCNSLYDPNSTGVGHKYLYFDQMAALYNHYTVIGSRIKITFSPPNTQGGLSGQTNTVVVGLQHNDDTSAVGSINWTLAEQTGAKVRTLAGGATQGTVLTSKWSAKKTFGGSILGNDNLQGSTVTSPTEQSYFVAFMQPYDISSTIAVYCMVEIEAIAVWDELKDVAGS